MNAESTAVLISVVVVMGLFAQYLPSQPAGLDAPDTFTFDMPVISEPGPSFDFRHSRPESTNVRPRERRQDFRWMRSTVSRQRATTRNGIIRESAVKSPQPTSLSFHAGSVRNILSSGGVFGLAG